MVPEVRLGIVTLDQTSLEMDLLKTAPANLKVSNFPSGAPYPLFHRNSNCVILIYESASKVTVIAIYLGTLDFAAHSRASSPMTQQFQ